MRRESGDYECDPYETSGQYGRETPRRHDYLADSFGGVQSYWLRQSQYWYDIVGRFVCGEYRIEDSSRDVARFWDNWMADYQRVLQFPHAKSLRGQVPNVVFVLDQHSEGCPPKEVPIHFGVSSPRPGLIATPLLSVNDGTPCAALINAELDERGYYARIKLVQARGVPAAECHLMSVVHTETNRIPVAVVHVVRRAASSTQAGGVSSGSSQAGPAAAAQTNPPVASLDVTLDIKKDLKEIVRRLDVLETSAAMKSSAPRATAKGKKG